MRKSDLISVSLKYIGDISYSLYLWHWPVLVVGQHLLLDKGLYSQLLLVATSFALADLSYRLIENPIRQHRAARISTKWQIVISLAAIALVNVQLIKWHNSATDRLVAQAESPFALARMDAPEIYRHGCDDWYSSAQVKVCHFGAKDAPKIAVVWGDSIGLQWFPAIKGALELETGQWRIEVITKSSCPIVDHPIFYGRLGRIYTECSDWRRDAAKYINKLTPDLLIVGSAGSYDLDESTWEQATLSLLKEDAMTAKQVAILAPTYALGMNGVTCLERHGLPMKDSENCHTRAEDPYRSATITALNRVATMQPRIHVIDLNGKVCPDRICRALINGTIVYRDSQHITATFAESLASAVKAELQLQFQAASYQ
ncbi:acyltransferase family protein [Halopseudomonas sp.]|uniref:acyltransferase family protein n=1 Tax=Halopseudomonas sp. TaxID=2901191 RepID=UPI00311F6929